MRDLSISNNEKHFQYARADVKNQFTLEKTFLFFYISEHFCAHLKVW